MLLRAHAVIGKLSLLPKRNLSFECLTVLTQALPIVSDCNLSSDDATPTRATAYSLSDSGTRIELRKRKQSGQQAKSGRSLRYRCRFA